MAAAFAVVPVNDGVVEEGYEEEGQHLHQHQLGPDQVQRHVQRVLHTHGIVTQLKTHYSKKQEVGSEQKRLLRW